MFEQAFEALLKDNYKLNMQIASTSQTKKQSPIADFIWHDREIRFDVHPNLLQMRAGEKLIDSIA